MLNRRHRRGDEGLRVVLAKMVVVKVLKSPRYLQKLNVTKRPMFLYFPTNSCCTLGCGRMNGNLPGEGRVYNAAKTCPPLVLSFLRLQPQLIPLSPNKLRPPTLNPTNSKGGPFCVPPPQGRFYCFAPHPTCSKASFVSSVPYIRLSTLCLKTYLELNSQSEVEKV